MINIVDLNLSHHATKELAFVPPPIGKQFNMVYSLRLKTLSTLKNIEIT